MQLFAPDTQSIQETVNLVNQVPVVQFHALLKRVAQRRLASADTPGACFSKDETNQLCEALSFTNGQLDLLVDGCTFILQKAAYQDCDVDHQLETFLDKQAGVSPQAAQQFQRVWNSTKPKIVKATQARSMNDPAAMPKLQTVHWELDMPLATSSVCERAFREQGCTTSATMHLGFDNPSADNLTLEFSHDELSQFFNQVEQIQEQLDKVLVKQTD